MKSVLFVCVHNAGRSQMAAGFMEVLSEGKIQVLSAGSAPKDLINPVAVAAMAEKGIDIAAVAGTGEAGRIVKRDVDHYVPYTPAAGVPVVSAPVGVESYTDENVSQMRKTIARRLAESKFTAPHFY